MLGKQGRIEKAKEKLRRAVEKALRNKAQIAFLAAGALEADSRGNGCRCC
jgi:hypothetical protein